MIPKKDITWFVHVTRNQPVGYDEALKKKWASVARRIITALGKLLGYATADRDIHYNEGGIAVSGEVSLRSDDLYIQLSQAGHGCDVLYRTVAHRKDYGGGNNNFLQLDELTDLPAAAEKIKKLRRPVTA